MHGLSRKLEISLHFVCSVGPLRGSSAVVSLEWPVPKSGQWHELLSGSDWEDYKLFHNHRDRHGLNHRFYI